MILTGDCIEVMAGLPADSVDAVVTDPPYGLEFMGKEWDSFRTYAGGNPNMKPQGVAIRATEEGEWRPGRGFGGRQKNPRCRKCGKLARGNGACKCPVPDLDMRNAESGYQFQYWCEAWGREALRVTKPGGYLLAFGGTRTHHRLVCGLEDAGWIIRDELDWIYASGFPKGKANLKPAHEPIVLARKPGPLRPLAIDECRIRYQSQEDYEAPAAFQELRKGHPGGSPVIGMTAPPPDSEQNRTGRWPSNVLLSDPELFDSANPDVVGSGAVTTVPATYQRAEGSRHGGMFYARPEHDADGSLGYGDSGGYSRFFIVPKAGRADREPVLRGQLEKAHAGVAIRQAEPGEYDDFVYPPPEGIGQWLREHREAAGMSAKALCAVIGAHGEVNHGGAVSNWEQELNRPTPDQWRKLRDVLGFDDRYDEVMTTTTKVDRKLMDGALPARRENAHPTVKPTDLMRHLVRLVTPVGGTVLDCFLGSGSTAIAAEMEGFAWIGIEKDPEYVKIAEARLNGTQRGLGLDVPAPTTPQKRSTGHWPKERTPGSEGWGFTGQTGLEERFDKPEEVA